MNPKYTNALINESSPYLLQHAHNPVNWRAWDPAVFEEAKSQNKLVIISIGYSACHWCHVMEHESFEDPAVAEIMNREFICIKIDREEHPHIDSLYMTAVQLMNKQGGWPLNCFTLPDGRPVYGGTYFPKAAWSDVLKQLAELYKREPKKVIEYGEKITEVIKDHDLIQLQSHPETFYSGILTEHVNNWAKTFDHVNGGPTRAPKFPLPTNYQFLLYYGHIEKRPLILDHVHLTLRKMAMGGIYDQLGGGFARYSVDELWKVPHFEKMLYDNAQLVSLYCDAFRQSGDVLYKKTVTQSLEFIDRELSDGSGAFYSALDADSEGIEGKYYVWTEEELKQLLNPEEYWIIENVYNINKKGFWEHDYYILLCDRSEEEVRKSLDIPQEQFERSLQTARHKMLRERVKRIRPGLDDKILLSWNAMMVKAYADASITFRDKAYLDRAKKAIQFIEQNFYTDNGGLWHTHKNGKSRIMGLLEDYAFLIEAYISLYQSTFEEQWLERSKSVLEYCIAHFSDEEDLLFYFNHDEDEKLIARKKELSDNVIPAGNSVMACNLFILGNYYYQQEWLDRSRQMLQVTWEAAKTYLPGYSNWAKLVLWLTEPFHEVSITGPDAHNWATNGIPQQFHPNSLFAVSNSDSTLPMLAGKHKEGTTLAYVCHNKFCEKPFSSFEELNSAIK